MAFNVRDIDETQAPLLDHLIELRARLLRAIAALVWPSGFASTSPATSSGS